MGARRMKVCGRNRRLRVGLFLLLILSACFSTRANVYATDIQINGSLQAGVVVPGGPLTISYILNDTATNVSVRIYAGASVAKVFTSEDGGAGAKPGLNTIVWDGTNDNGSAAAEGVYNVSITAAAAGYGAWTNITDDSASFFVGDPTGIAVNKNTNSPYLGRVFVGNAPPPQTTPIAVYKFNADGSPADEGSLSQTYPWSGYLFSPWKIAIAQDDTVYINDWSQGGRVMAFDETISTNYVAVLDTANYPYPTAQLSGPFVTGGGTNTQIWMADANTNGLSVGVVRWDATPFSGVGPTDTVIVPINPSGLDLSAYDVAVDASSNIYVIQCLDGFTYPSDFHQMPRLFAFPPYAGQPVLTTNWSVASLDYSLENAAGVAVDPTGQWVAVAVEGYGSQDVLQLQNGAVNIYRASDGRLVTRLGAGTNHTFLAVAWDLAGNLYATDLNASVWRAYSPPGTNQATTVAVPILQVYDAFLQPLLTPTAAPVPPASQFTFTLQGQANVAYTIESSTDLVKWISIATNYDTVALRTITVPALDTACFFQALVP